MPTGFDQRYEFDSPAAAVGAMVRGIGDTGLGRPSLARPLIQARGMVLAERVTLDRNSPAFDQSSMDGYAVRTSDLVGSGAGADVIALDVACESRIGHPPPEMPSRPAGVRIATGAPLPLGPRAADAILKREDVTEIEHNGEVTRIVIPRATLAKAAVGQFIRRQGENARAGDPLLNPGTLLTSAALGALAAVGCTNPSVYQPVRIAIITTGDEVVGDDAALGTHQIRNANAPTLAAIVSAHGWLDLASAAHMRDDGPALLTALREAVDHCDAVILSGGVSMGHRDPVRAAVESLGAAVVFHGLPQRPGKPMLAAILRTGSESRAPVPIFGLPGNPVSSLVTCTRIVVPVLGALAGLARWPDPPLVRVANGDEQAIGLWWHRPVRGVGPGLVELVAARSSGDSIAAGASDGFVEVPPGHRLAPNSRVACYHWA